MWSISCGTAAPAAETDSPPNVRWSTNRSCGPSSSKSMATRRCGPGGVAASTTRSWPLMPRCASNASPESRGNHKYLPRRFAATTRRPAKVAAKSAAPGRCRRIARGCRTSTALIRRPTTQRASPRRTVSTSGSSGTRRQSVSTVAPPSIPSAVISASSAFCRIRFHASSAACCSASFLLRPEPPP